MLPCRLLYVFKRIPSEVILKSLLIRDIPNIAEEYMQISEWAC